MTTLTLDAQEVEILKKAIGHCRDKCQQGGAEKGCEDCATLEKIYQKLSQMGG